MVLEYIWLEYFCDMWSEKYYIADVVNYPVQVIFFRGGKIDLTYTEFV